MTSFVFRRQMTIEWGHCDPAGIVFNSRYFEFFDTGTWLLLGTALNVPPPKLAAAFGIVGVPLVDARAEFFKPAAFGATIEIASRVAAFRRSSFEVEHKITLAGELAVEGSETRVWAVRHKDDPERIAGAPIPAEVIAKFG